MSNTTALVFNDTCFDVIDRDGQPWIKASQLARALGYSREELVGRLYKRNADEFTDSMTQVIEILDNTTLGKSNLINKTRIFSLRGCHLLAMFARTAVAKAFRVWVLDVLEHLNMGGSRPAIETTSLSTPDDRAPLRSLVQAWSQASGLHYSALWPQVKAYFQLSRIEDLPVGWIPDALAFVQMKIDECQRGKQKALPAAEPTPQERMAAEGIVKLRRLCNEFSMTSDTILPLFAKDELIQSLNIVANLSNYALLTHYQGMAATERR